MRRLLSLLLVLCLALPAMAQAPNPIRLWTGDVPGALGQTPNDIPTLTPFLPDAKLATGAAMVVCPGGGYSGLAFDHEGTVYARWLNQYGIAAFVLRYRLGSRGYRHPVMLWDVSRAMRMVRAQATQWNVDPNRIGIMGSSAGGHLASTLLTHYDAGKPDSTDLIERVSSKPNLGVLCYAVISMGPDTHQGSKDNLLGNNPSPELVTLLSNELQVTSQTPPTFVWHTVADNVVKVENALAFASALQKNGVKYDLHLYQNGGHGLGLGDDTPPFKNTLPWTKDLIYWLRIQNFLQRPLVATSESTPQNWRYTTTAPAENWTQPNFSDAAWTSAPGAFGTLEGVKIGTQWTTGDVWLRRTVTLPNADYSNARIRMIYDEDAEVYFNGVPALKATGYTTSYVSLPITPEAQAQLKAGTPLNIAVHCHQTGGGQGIDVGLVTEIPQTP